MMRICDSCGQVDDGPRHVFVDSSGAMGPQSGAGLSAQAVAVLATLDPAQAALIEAEAADPLFIQRHPACCAAAGCPDHVCQEA